MNKSFSEDVRYPEIKVRLVGEDANSFSIIGRVVRAMKKEHILQEEIQSFIEDATSGNHDHLLQTCLKWVTCY